MSEQQQNQPLKENKEVVEAPVFEEEGSTVFVKREYNDKKPPKNGGARRRILALVSLVVGLAVLAGGIFAVARFLPQEEPTVGTSSSLGKLGFSLVKVDTAQIEKIELTNQKGSFTVFPKQEVTSSGSTSSQSTETVWQVEGIDPSLTTSSSILSFVSDCADIEALRKMNSTSGEFGFAEPTAKIAVTCTDSSLNYTVTVGKPSADSVGYYAKLTDDTVYIIDSSYISPLLGEATDFANTQIFSGVTEAQEPDYFSDGKLIYFDYVTFAGKNFEKPIRMEKNPEVVIGLGYVITEPKYRVAKDEPVQEFLTLFSEQLSGSGMFSYVLTPALKAQYGLNDPQVVMEAKIGDFKTKLTVGNLIDGYYAVMAEGVNAIYKVSADAIPFVTSSPRTYYSPRFYYEMLDSISTLTLSGNGKTYTFTPTFTGEKDMTVAYEGENKSPAIFKAFYRNILALGLQDYVDTDTAGATVLTITTKFNTDKADSTVTFTEYSNRVCLVKVNGVVLGTIPQTQVNNILEYAQRVVDGQEVPEPAVG